MIEPRELGVSVVARASVFARACAVLACVLAVACRSAPEAIEPVRSTSAPVDAAARDARTPAAVRPTTIGGAAQPVAGPRADGTWRAELGTLAPEFELFDLEGRSHSLWSARGKIVVLEWFDPTCPYVEYAYDEGPLAEMKARLATRGVVWLAINSSAPGRVGASANECATFLARRKVDGTCLLDPTGVVGRTYGARTAPHLYVINERGLIVYSGALDNAPMGRVESASSRTNYVENAIADLRSGHAVTVSSTRPYGCAVKYDRP